MKPVRPTLSACGSRAYAANTASTVAFGAVRRMPWVVSDGGVERIEPRWVTQLAVSFDHRLVDGQQGSQFLSNVAAVLTDPGLALL